MDCASPSGRGGEPSACFCIYLEMCRSDRASERARGRVFGDRRRTEEGRPSGDELPGKSRQSPARISRRVRGGGSVPGQQLADEIQGLGQRGRATRIRAAWRARARHREGDDGARERVVGGARGARDAPGRAGGRRDVRGCVFPIFPSRTERYLPGRVPARADARAPTRRPPPDPPTPSTLDPPPPRSSDSTPPAPDRARARPRPRVVVVTSRLDLCPRHDPTPDPSPLSIPPPSPSLHPLFFRRVSQPLRLPRPSLQAQHQPVDRPEPPPRQLRALRGERRFGRVPRGLARRRLRRVRLRRRVPRKNPPLGQTRQTRRVHVLVPRPHPRGDGRAVAVRRRMGRRESLLVRVRR